MCTSGTFVKEFTGTPIGAPLIPVSREHDRVRIDRCWDIATRVRAEEIGQVISNVPRVNVWDNRER